MYWYNFVLAVPNNCRTIVYYSTLRTVPIVPTHCTGRRKCAVLAVPGTPLHYGQNTTGVVYLPWEFVGLVFIPIAKKYPRIGYAK